MKTIREIDPNLLARAAVLVTFDPETLLGDGIGSDDVFDLLNERCELVVTPSGRHTWTLVEQTRRQALGTLSLQQLRAARSQVDPAERSLVQSALDRSLDAGWGDSSFKTMTADEARGLAVVADWWQGENPDVPPSSKTAELLDRLNLFGDVREMATDHFIGRAAILGELRRHLRGEGSAVFALHGVGGIGKSAILARHIVWALDETTARVARLDFDDPTLNPYFALDNLARVVALVARQSTGTPQRRLDRLADVARDAAATSGFGLEASSRDVFGVDWRAVGQIVEDLVACRCLGSWCLVGRL